MYVIYIMQNLVNDKLYVGQTKNNLHTYILQQKSAAYLPRRKHSKPNLYAAIRKYGIDSFKTYSVCECETQQDADFCEIAFIAALGTQNRSKGYNITDGGRGCSGRKPWNKGIKMSKEFSELCKQVQAKRFKNGPAARLGKRHTDQTKAKISATMKARKIAPSLEARILGGKVKTKRDNSWLEQH